jgi:hypothetical protein
MSQFGSVSDLSPLRASWTFSFPFFFLRKPSPWSEPFHFKLNLWNPSPYTSTHISFLTSTLFLMACLSSHGLEALKLDTCNPYLLLRKTIMCSSFRIGSWFVFVLKTLFALMRWVVISWSESSSMRIMKPETSFHYLKKCVSKWYIDLHPMSLKPLSKIRPPPRSSSQDHHLESKILGRLTNLGNPPCWTVLLWSH